MDNLLVHPFMYDLASSPSLRPYEKKVDFYVNNARVDFGMKLGEGGEAFFIFQTEAEVPRELQTSPIASPADSPLPPFTQYEILSEPEYLDLNAAATKAATAIALQRPVSRAESAPDLEEKSSSDGENDSMPHLRASSLPRSGSRRSWNFMEEATAAGRARRYTHTGNDAKGWTEDGDMMHLAKLPEHTTKALENITQLERRLSIPIGTSIYSNGNVLLDTRGYKSSHSDVKELSSLAKQILLEDASEEGLGRFIQEDQVGNLWIYASEEAKSDGFGQEDEKTIRIDSIYNADLSAVHTIDQQPVETIRPKVRRQPSLKYDPNLNYAKTLRLSDAQLKGLNLSPGINPMSFSVTSSYYGLARVVANIFFWKHDVPIVISDIDGTITKSDALGHVLTIIGRDWTHDGVAKLYADIRNNGYNILYLTSRSVGQADSTRDYLKKIVQSSYRLPEGPVIMSPERTMAALRREMVIRKPQVFKMACLRDLHSLYGGKETPFYAGFGNRITDALSYRSVGVPSSRIFTINSVAEVKMELLEFAGYKSSYIHMTDLVDHFFPPIGQVQAEEYTDLFYWRPTLPEVSSEEEGEEDEEVEEYDEGEEEDEDDEYREELKESNPNLPEQSDQKASPLASMDDLQEHMEHFSFREKF